jgi:hypothetical protein
MRDPLVEQSFTYRQMLTLALVLVIGAVLVPTGVNAAASLFRLQDADSSVLAQVDGGKLRVGDGGGGLTVDGNVGISAQQSTVQLGARTPVGDVDYLDLEAFSSSVSQDVYVVPAGNRLVLDTISVQATLPDTERVRVALRVFRGGTLLRFFSVPLTFELQQGFFDFWGATIQVRGYAEPGDKLNVQASRVASESSGEVGVSWSGHLVPA